MYYYAQLNMDDIVEAIVSFAFPVTSDYLIQIPSYDESLIGKRYNRETGMFEEAAEGVKVTEHDKRLWDNTPIAELSLVDTSTNLASGSTKKFTVEFANPILGYTPRKVLLQFYDYQNYAGQNTGRKVTRSSSVIMERDMDNTRRLFVKSGNLFSVEGLRSESYGEGYAENVNDAGVFQISRVRDGSTFKIDSYGGQCFLNVNSTLTNGSIFSIIEIGLFTFNQNSVSFTIKVPADYESARTSIHMIGWVY